MNPLELESLVRALYGALFGTVVRSSVIALLCAFVVLFFRSRTAEIRHFIWCGTLYGLLTLPLLQMATPPLAKTSFVVPRQETMLAAVPTPDRATRPPDVTVVAHVKPKHDPWQFLNQLIYWFWVPAALYAAITCAFLLRLLLSFLGLQRIAKRSEYIFDQDLHDLGHEVWLESLSLFKPRIRVSADIAVPMVIGIHEIFILLPRTWNQWPRHKLRAVLAHEMAHVRRGDTATAVLSSLAVCLFWMHPLTYWLRRQLAALAEEACDEAALRFIPPKQYSQILIEFASSVSAARGRLLTAPSVAAHRSQIVKRLERAFAIRPRAGATYGAVRVLLIAAFFPTLYFAAAAARFEQAAPLSSSAVTPERAEAVELELQQQPESQNMRGSLMALYANLKDYAQLNRHLLWVIDHHPDWPIATIHIYDRPGQPGVSENRALIKAAWEQALTRHPDSAEVQVNAASYFLEDDAVRALGLLQQAWTMPSQPLTQQLSLQMRSQIYAVALLTDLYGDANRHNNIAMTPSVAKQLWAELETSNDAGLLVHTGTLLVVFENGRQEQKGLALIQKAIDLEPNNREWQTAMEWAKAQPARRKNLEELSKGPVSKGEVRIGAEVANANLQTKVEPQYPPLARQARVEGDVEFTVDIGPDGHIQSLQLVRGPSLLVNAAKDAVLQSIYRPTLLNGQAVSVRTDVTVPFRLNP